MTTRVDPNARPNVNQGSQTGAVIPNTPVVGSGAQTAPRPSEAVEQWEPAPAPYRTATRQPAPVAPAPVKPAQSPQIESKVPALSRQQLRDIVNRMQPEDKPTPGRTVESLAPAYRIDTERGRMFEVPNLLDDFFSRSQQAKQAQQPTQAGAPAAASAPTATPVKRQGWAGPAGAGPARVEKKKVPAKAKPAPQQDEDIQQAGRISAEDLDLSDLQTEPIEGSSSTQESAEEPSTQTDPVLGFQGKYRFLSNFYPVRIEYEGDFYPSVEHAYQASKTLDRKQRVQFQQGQKLDPSKFSESKGKPAWHWAAAAAKKAGRRVKMQPMFDDMKLAIMSRLVRQKFMANEDLFASLLDTGDAYLEETNDWGDDYWGVPRGKTGQNLLGKILMRLRQVEGRVETAAEAEIQEKILALESLTLNAPENDTQAKEFDRRRQALIDELVLLRNDPPKVVESTQKTVEPGIEEAEELLRDIPEATPEQVEEAFAPETPEPAPAPRRKGLLAALMESGEIKRMEAPFVAEIKRAREADAEVMRQREVDDETSRIVDEMGTLARRRIGLPVDESKPNVAEALDRETGRFFSSELRTAQGALAGQEQSFEQVMSSFHERMELLEQAQRDEADLKMLEEELEALTAGRNEMGPFTDEEILRKAADRLLHPVDDLNARASELTDMELAALDRKNFPGRRGTKSRIMARAEKIKNEIRGYMDYGLFQLVGDTMDVDPKTGVVTITHSPEVVEAINFALDWFGHTWSEFNEARLFEAFQVYRGMGLDNKQKLFKMDPDDVEMGDQLFIKGLMEMCENAQNKNNPFAYTHPSANFGGRQRYPVIPSERLAKFFVSGDPKKNNLQIKNASDLIKGNIVQWNDVVRPRMVMMAEFDQQETLYNMVEAVAEMLPGNYDIDVRPGDGRISLSELLEGTSEFALESNDKNLLKEVANEQYRREYRAIIARDRRRRRGSLDRPLTPDEAAKDPTRFWIKATATLRGTAAAIRTIQVIGLIPLAPTGIVEHASGLVRQSAGVRLLRAFGGEAARPTKETITRAREADFSGGVGEAIKLLASQGQEAVIDAAARGVRFDKQSLKEERRGPGGKLIGASETAVDTGMSFTTGDWFGQARTGQIFIEYLTYLLNRSQRLEERYAKKGGKAASRFTKTEISESGSDTFTARLFTGAKITSKDVEAAMMGDPIGFLQEILKRPEGMAALVFAANTSLAGVNPATEALRKATANVITDLAVGSLVGWFMKFGINGAMTMIPFSNTALFAIKKGVINPGKFVIGKSLEAVGLREQGETEAKIAASNELLYAGNEEFWHALGQNTVIDIARFGTTQFPAYAFAWVMVGLFGGVDEPDDPELRHIYSEWKINDEAIRENWYWNEILGFAMPFAIAMHVGAATGDNKLARQILWHGVVSKMEDNPWTNVLDIIDIMNNFDQQFVEQQERAENYGGPAISKSEFLETQATAFLLSRLGKAIEPAFLMQFYREHSMGLGDHDLAYSTTMLWTGDEEDPTDPNLSWSDTRYRRVALQHPSIGFLLNVVTGFYTDNPEATKNGYMRGQGPLVSNGDPAQMKWVYELSVLDENGDFVTDVQLWTEDQKWERVNAVLDLIDNDIPPSKLRGYGLVIPYEARSLTADYLLDPETGLKAQIRNEYEARKDAGEWYPAYLPENSKAKNAAWQEVVRKQGEIDAIADKLFSDEIPYGADKYNRWETNYRPIYRWKEGTVMFGEDVGGEPATDIDYRLFRDKIDFEMYAVGDHKSTLRTKLTVDDNGENTYNAQTPVSWQTNPEDWTDEDWDWVEQAYKDYVYPTGMYQGQNAYELITAGGMVGPSAPADAAWDTNKLLFPSRAMLAVQEPTKKLDREDYKWQPTAAAAPAATNDDSGGGGGGGWSYGGWGGGGGGSYSPNIYSHAPYNLNSDKPAGLYTKVPYSARFDYLRPSVRTKGSREAYRREDF